MTESRACAARPMSRATSTRSRTKSPTRTEWHKIAQAKGLKQALTWRDGPFGDGWGAKRPLQTRDCSH